jgi:hypothetical protein
MLLQNKILKEQPTVVMLQETKFYNDSISTISSRIWKGSQVFVVDSQGVEGGLTILWNLAKFSITDFFSTQRSISTQF